MKASLKRILAILSVAFLAICYGKEIVKHIKADVTVSIK